MFYARRPEFETAEEKLSFLSSSKLQTIDLEEIQPDAKQNWIGVTDNDFTSLFPLIDKDTKSLDSARSSSDLCLRRFLVVCLRRETNGYTIFREGA